MAVPIRQLLSQTIYDTDGATTVWNFSFSDGYIDQDYVKAHLRNKTTGFITAVPLIEANFTGPFQLTLSPAFATGSELVIYRETPATAPIVNFADLSSLTEIALDTNARQAIHLGAEAIDGLDEAVTLAEDISAFVMAAEDAADASAASAALAAADAAASDADRIAAAASAAAAAASAASITLPLPIASGGTGQTTAAAARTALGSTAVGDAVFIAASAQAAKAALAIQPVGQCLLTKSGANLLLSRHNGSFLFINGLHEQIPSAGVTLAATSVVSGTQYYVYAFMSGSTMTLERVTDVPVVDTTYGHRVKTGDATRTLVGAAISNSAGNWVDTPAYRGVSSWFNRKAVSANIPLSGSISRATGSGDGEIDSSYRVSAFVWANDVVECFHFGSMSNDTVGTCGVHLRAISGPIGSNVNIDAVVGHTAAGAAYQSSAGCRIDVPVTTDGLAVLGLYGSTAAGTMTVIGGALGQRAVLSMNVSA